MTATEGKNDKGEKTRQGKHKVKTQVRKNETQGMNHNVKYTECEMRSNEK